MIVDVAVNVVSFHSCFSRSFVISVFNGSFVLRMAIVTNYVVFIVVFVVGIPYYRLAIFTI